MATDYIKVSPHVAARMGLSDYRATFPDGNHILWPKDLALADPDWAFHPDQTLADIGGIRLNPLEAKLEMGAAPSDCRPLPEPASDIWRTPAAVNRPDPHTDNPQPATDNGEQTTDNGEPTTEEPSDPVTD